MSNSSSKVLSNTSIISLLISGKILIDSARLVFFITNGFDELFNGSSISSSLELLSRYPFLPILKA